MLIIDLPVYKKVIGPSLVYFMSKTDMIRN